VAVSERSKNADNNPSAGFYGGEVYAAWSTNDPAISPGGDRSIAMRKVDLVTGAVGGVVHVTDAGSAGYDDQPALIEWDGDLQVLWASGSSHNQTGVLVNDTDIHWRAWDGSALSEVKLVSPPDDDTFKEFNPAFLVVDDALHATFIMDVNTPATGKAHDQRQMTRLLLRGPRESDGFVAMYRPLYEVSGESREVVVQVRFAAADGQTIPAYEHMGLTFANGTNLTFGSAAEVEMQFPVTGGQVEAPSNGSWCGKPLPIEALPPPQRVIDQYWGWWIGTAGGLALLGVGWLVWRRQRTRPPTEPSGRSE
jgi:hypothetical protein